MIVAVIADDLSGAAELAGAAADSGFSAEVQTSFDPSSPADVIAVDADTRSMSPDRARQVAGELTHRILRATPKWIYKKTDSVLRGNVRAEIEAVLETTGLRRALFIPANPSKGRVIRGGIYYVNGVPLAQTSFANDPVHPRRSSEVIELLSCTGSASIARARADEDSSAAAIVVPDVEDVETIRRRAVGLDEQTLAAGGVEFFEALLETRLGKHTRAISPAPSRDRVQLFICGSAQAWCQGRSALCERHGVPVLTMPDECWSTGGSVRKIGAWAEQIANAIVVRGRAMVAIGSAAPSNDPSKLAESLAATISVVLRKMMVHAVCVEGGATAASVLRAMTWTRLTALPAGDLPGVSALRPVGLDRPVLYVKPGSYPWPATLWPQPIQEDLG
jgi:uncharacterized protein YgbK (DUF1537 family)